MTQSENDIFWNEILRLDKEGSHLQVVTLLTKQLQANPDEPGLFLFRAQQLIKLEKFKEAASDGSRAVELGGGTEAHMIHGRALFTLGKYLESKSAFIAAKNSRETTTSGLDPCAQWLQWCEDRIKKLNITDSSKQTNETDKTSSEVSTNTAASTDPNFMPAPKVKHDWYQTDSHTIITIMVKGVKNEEVKIDFHDASVSITAKLPAGSEYSLEMDLCHPIRPAESSYKVLSTKIELKMKKVDCIRWATLEGDGAAPTCKSSNTDVSTVSALAYPTSSNKKKDWDKIVEAEVKKDGDDKLEGEAALNQLFQKIYSEGNEEVQRAMNKSFSESGGTVLSTNWKEIGDQQIDVKPPDGMEWKKWEK